MLNGAYRVPILKSLLQIVKVKLVGPKIGRDHFGTHKTALISNKRNCRIHPSALVCEGVLIRAMEGKVEIGANTQVGPYTVILSGSGVFLGSCVLISPHVTFAAGNHDYKQVAVPMRFAGGISSGPIIVEDDVWIGASSCICDGVRIGRGSVIGAGSVVTSNIPQYSIAVGIPASTTTTDSANSHEEALLC